MNSKSMKQLLAPFAVTAGLFIASYLASFILGVTKISKEWAYHLEIDIFDFGEMSTTIFWIINVILIIWIEVIISED